MSSRVFLTATAPCLVLTICQVKTRHDGVTVKYLKRLNRISYPTDAVQAPRALFPFSSYIHLRIIRKLEHGPSVIVCPVVADSPNSIAHRELSASLLKTSNSPRQSSQIHCPSLPYHNTLPAQLARHHQLRFSPISNVSCLDCVPQYSIPFQVLLAALFPHHMGTGHIFQSEYRHLTHFTYHVPTHTSWRTFESSMHFDSSCLVADSTHHLHTCAACQHDRECIERFVRPGAANVLYILPLAQTLLLIH